MKGSINVLQLLPLADEKDGMRGVTGTERVALSIIRNWKYSKFKLYVAYSSKGLLYQDVNSCLPKNQVIDFYISKHNRIINIIKLLYILHKKNIQLVHTHGPLYTDFIATVASRIFKITNVVSRHVMYKDLMISKTKKIIFGAMDKYTKKKATYITSICNSGKAALVSEGCEKKKIVNIYNAVDINDIYSESKEAIYPKNTDLKIIMAAQMTKVKRFDILTKTIEKSMNNGKKWHAIFVGNGPLFSKNKMYAEKLGVSKQVSFIGHKDRLMPFFKASDVCVLISDREGVPMVLMEAMICGLPIITNNVGGSSELLKNNGYLLSSPDVNELYCALCKLETMEIRKKLSNNSLEFIQNYSLNKMIAGYESVYEKAYNEKLLKC